MKFTMDAKELKTMMDRGMSVINKKTPAQSLTRLYFQVDENGIVKVWGTDMEHYTEIRSDNAYMTSPGILGIDIDDVKIISKMNGEITLEDVTTEDMKVGKINIKCGKKTVTIPRYANTDVFLPAMDETEAKIIGVKENWLLETITNLAKFTSNQETNKMMQTFNFNTKAKRIEALDGYRIGMRSLESQKIYNVADDEKDYVKLHNMCVPVFKKLMDKKSESEIIIYQDKKYIRIVGNDFIYVIRRIDGEYFKVDPMIKFYEDFKFVPERENILSVMKYDLDLIKTAGEDRKPIVFHSKNGNLCTYAYTRKYEAFDELETSENNMKDDLYIGFNPRFLVDVFEIVDSDNPICLGTNPKAPMMIYGSEYSFLVLPINIAVEDKANIKRKFESEAA
jgi:DNA polymerase III sliding clamp (beta) subunit (PCNA family)